MPLAPPCPLITVLDALLDVAQEQLRDGNVQPASVLVGLTRELISSTIGPTELVLDTLLHAIVAAAEDHPELATVLCEVSDLAELEWDRYNRGCRELPRCQVCVAHGVQPECDDPGLDDEGDEDGPW